MLTVTFPGRVCVTQADHEPLHGLLYSRVEENPASSRLWIGHDVFEFATFERVRNTALLMRLISVFCCLELSAVLKCSYFVGVGNW